MTKIGFFIKSNDYTLLIFILEVLSGSQKSEVHIPQSKIRNQKSAIHNPQSAIHNPKSLWGRFCNLSHLYWCVSPMRYSQALYWLTVF